MLPEQQAVPRTGFTGEAHFATGIASDRRGLISLRSRTHLQHLPEDLMSESTGRTWFGRKSQSLIARTKAGEQQQHYLPVISNSCTITCNATSDWQETSFCWPADCSQRSQHLRTETRDASNCRSWQVIYMRATAWCEYEPGLICLIRGKGADERQIRASSSSSLSFPFDPCLIPLPCSCSSQLSSYTDVVA